jgi:transcriptional regulator with XRE-family HTH domain
MDFDYKTLGKNIKSLRRQKGLTQAQLAEMIDKTDSHIGQIENARGIPSLETAAAIANALETGIDRLVSGNLINKRDFFIERLMELCTGMSYKEKDMALDLFVSMLDVLGQYNKKE